MGSPVATEPDIETAGVADSIRRAITNHDAETRGAILASQAQDSSFRRSTRRRDGLPFLSRSDALMFSRPGFIIHSFLYTLRQLLDLFSLLDDGQGQGVLIGLGHFR